MKLSTCLPDGRVEDFELPGPGGGFRFGVGVTGTALSGVWRLWSNQSTSDVYVAARSIAGVVKISLHESGDWRLQWNSRDHAAKYTSGGPRLLEQWSQPAERGAGVTVALTVLVPPDDLIPHPYPTQQKKPVLWVPPPPPERLAAFHIIIWKPDQGIAEFKGMWPIGCYVLANGQACLLTYGSHPKPPGQHEELLSYRRQLLELAQRQQFPLTGNIRAVMYGRGDDGRPVIFDLAVGAIVDSEPDGET